jgi:flavodoxin short chain
MEVKMKKGLIIYGSTTGNTEDMAGTIGQVLQDSGVETEIKDVSDAEVGDLTSDYDVLVLGCPAYGDDTIELQEDFEEFYEQIDGIKLDGKKFAVFAPGDSSYKYFCGSVDMLEERLDF